MHGGLSDGEGEGNVGVGVEVEGEGFEGARVDGGVDAEF